MTNKNIVYGMLVAILAFGVSVIGCDNGTTNQDPPKSMDSRLVGGKWYSGSTGQNVYYRFTSSDFIATTNGALGEITTAAYTENGQVKATANGTVLLSYIFVQPSEYDDEIAAAQLSGDKVLWYTWRRRQIAAQSGNMVRFTVVGTTVEWARWENVPSGVNNDDSVPSGVNNDDREKWQFFDHNNLYVDEMIFNTTIPQDFWGNWGYEEYIVATNESTNEFDLLDIDYTLWLINSTVQYPTSENKYSNISFILSENTLIFSLNIYTNDYSNPSYPPYLYNKVILSKSEILFNLVAAKKYISKASDWDINDYYDDIVYYFLSEDKKYGFTFVVYGYNLFYGHNMASVSTNLFYIPNGVHSFMDFNASKLE